ncbi:hypothetical protein J1605_017018 [Eschrichtius robustus]|uniref:phosphopyruvate hydratase n=1 Tax=Eschrichtius robustus TaxID=9764 RepID=A0AB34HYE6_ESCRO|nr:hypothetical protein J1605_017018 [Eschrichtius robustus]
MSPGWQCRSDWPVPAFIVIQGSSHASNELAAQEFVILTVGAVTSGKPCSWQQKPTSTRSMSSEMWQRCFVEGHFAPNILEKELAKHGSQPLHHSDELVNEYKSFIKDYLAASTEDALDQYDWETWKFSTSGGGAQVVWDGFTVTNLKCIPKPMGKDSVQLPSVQSE